MNLAQVKKLVIPEGEVRRIEKDGAVLWRGGYTNQVPLSTDTDGSIFNGTGYKDNVRLSSSGGISGSAQSGSTTTGFIPINGAADIIRMKGVEWVTATDGKHYYLNYYDANRTFLDYTSAAIYANGNMGHILTVTRDADGVETVVWNESYGTTNTLLQHVRKAAFVRITARGSGANMIVTVNEEIT